VQEALARGAGQGPLHHGMGFALAVVEELDALLAQQVD
jgi:hypothetical protein